MRDLKPEEIGHVYGAGGCGNLKHAHHRDGEHRRNKNTTTGKRVANTEGNNTLQAGHETGGRGLPAA
jgi:hypothetical protein